MTKRQLKALEAIPAVIDALESLGRDAERLRLAMAKAAGLGVLPPQSIAIKAPRLRTTEEQEALMAGTQDYNPEEEETPDKKRQRELLATFRKSPARQNKLAQFEHDGPEAA